MKLYEHALPLSLVLLFGASGPQITFGGPGSGITGHTTPRKGGGSHATYPAKASEKKFGIKMPEMSLKNMHEVSVGDGFREMSDGENILIEVHGVGGSVSHFLFGDDPAQVKDAYDAAMIKSYGKTRDKPVESSSVMVDKAIEAVGVPAKISEIKKQQAAENAKSREETKRAAKQHGEEF